MKLDVFIIQQERIEKYGELEVVRDQIIWMNTNINNGTVSKAGFETGTCDETLNLQPVPPTIAEQYVGKVSHQLDLPIVRRKNLFLNLNKEQLNEIYPPVPVIQIQKKKPHLLKILGFAFTGIEILVTALSIWL